MSSEDISSLDKSDSNQEDEINPRLIFNSLKRNKRLITTITLLGIILSGIIAFTTKRKWQGGFQIVLAKESPTASLINDDRLIKLLGTRRGEKLTTEIEILKSPSILMTIFEFAKSKKEFRDTSMVNLRFDEWKKNLEINLTKDTSVLTIAYNDTDKDLILPVLNKISKTYQDYSGRKRRRSIELGMSYFEKQISEYSTKKNTSIKAAQQFAMDQDLMFRKDGSLIVNDQDLIFREDGTLIPIDIETRRLQAANEIRLIDEKLDQIKLLKDKTYEILYLASTNVGLTDLSQKLKRIDYDLTSKRQIYTNNDLVIIELLKKRDLYNKLVKEEVVEILKAKRADAQARLKASERPKGVLIEYGNLLFNVIKDTKTLNSLEDQYRTLSLEKARYTDPWELITKPTLLPNPIAPNKRQILTMGSLVSFFTGCGVSLVLEKRKDIIAS